MKKRVTVKFGQNVPGVVKKRMVNDIIQQRVNDNAVNGQTNEVISVSGGRTNIRQDVNNSDRIEPTETLEINIDDNGVRVDRINFNEGGASINAAISDSPQSASQSPSIQTDTIEVPGVPTPKAELKTKVEALKTEYRLLSEDSVKKNKWQESCRLEQEYWALRSEYFVLNRDTLWGSRNDVIKCVSTTPSKSEWIGADGRTHVAECSLQQCINDHTIDTLCGSLTGTSHYY